MAYTLFAQNLVDYADKYRGMQAVELEAFADVTLKQVHGGSNYTVPPYFIDSVAHLAGFVMNVSDASDTANTFCVTPGWNSMRFARPLVAGQKYRSYVKMIPTSEDPSVYLGDVDILQDGVIMGMVGGIQFRRYPRILLNRFFSAPDSAAAKSYATEPTPATAAAPTVKVAPQKATSAATPPAPPAVAKIAPPPAPAAVDSDSTARKAPVLIAKEAGMDCVGSDRRRGVCQSRRRQSDESGHCREIPRGSRHRRRRQSIPRVSHDWGIEGVVGGVLQLEDSYGGAFVFLFSAALFIDEIDLITRMDTIYHLRYITIYSLL